MKKKYFYLLLAIFCFGGSVAQETQKNHINYQGVARDANNELMINESMLVTISLRFGSATSISSYEENHSVTTDANGVFGLQIGSGAVLNGEYQNLPWGRLATYISIAVNGVSVGTTEMMAVPYAISSGDGHQSADQVPYNNTVSGLTATNTQEALDELASGGTLDTDNQSLVLTGDVLTIEDGAGSVDLGSYIDDADADPTNELQTISFNVATNELSLSDGNSVVIPSGGTDADADPTNELQTISFDVATNELSLSDGGSVTIPSGGTDADADPTNELQTLTFDTATNELSLSDGNSVMLPLAGSGTVFWEQNGTDLFYSGGNIGVGTNTPAIESGAARYLTVSPGSFPDDGAFGSLEIQGRQQTLEQPIGRIDFLSEGLVGSLGAIARIESRVTNSAQFRGDIGFFTKNGADIATAVLEERMTIKNDGNVGIGVTAPAANLHVNGNIRSNDLAGTGTRNVVADTNGNLTIGTGGGGSSVWIENGSGIHYTSGNVGIGTSTPETALDVASDIDFSFKLSSTIEQNYMAFFNDTGYKGYAGIWTAANDMDFGTGVGNTTGKVHLTTRATPKLTVDTDGDVGIGTTVPQSKLHVDGDIRSTDLAGTGTRNVVADSNGNLTIGSGGTSSSAPVVFKVKGSGFGVKDLNGDSIIETDIWETIVYDTNTAFNTTTKRFVAPETGYYYLHATLKQSNAVTNAFFGIKFNVIGSWLDATYVDGDDVKTEISGIFRLTAGEEVFVELRNYSTGLNVRVDGFGSIFEGYKIN